MPNGRILYFTTDDAKPSGGGKTIYQHVGHLVRNGFPAFVVHNRSGFRPPFFKIDVPVLYWQDNFPLSAEDIVVIPEDHVSALEGFARLPNRKVVFCQNHFYVFAGLRNHASWAELGITQVLASSDVIADFLRTALGIADVSVVHYAIDPAVFQPRPKKMQIAYMPRKRAFECDFIRNLAGRLSAAMTELAWVSIHEMTESQCAEILGKSAVFLSLSHLEGFGMPPVEAMACGCVVVGFHGYGGLEYATSDNGFWCPEGDPIACAKMLCRVAEKMKQGSQDVEAVVRNALATAAWYVPTRQERELIDYWQRFFV